MTGSRRATVCALVLCCTLACITATTFPSFAPRRPFVLHSSASAALAPRPLESTLALRGGSSEEGDEQPPQQQQESGAASLDEDELSIEDEQDEEIAPGILDGDAVSVSADAFIHPAHVEDDVDVEDVELAEGIETTADVVVDGDDAFYPAAVDENEGSTTPVTPDEDDDDGDGAVVGKEEEEEEPVVPTVEEEECLAAQETDDTRLQSGSTFTDDESAAYVDRMDLADDEGEAPVMEAETEAVVPSGTDEDLDNNDDGDDDDGDDDNTFAAEQEAAAPSITDAIADIEEDVIDPLDLSEVQSTREALERERQATVAAATQTARGASASTAQGAASVQYMITRNMRNVLMEELGYTDAEVDNMKPDVAAVLTSKRLKRPSTGMPDAFYVDGKPPSPKKNPLNDIMKSKVVQRIILPAVGIGLSALVTANAIQHSRIDSTAISIKQNAAVSAPITPVPGEQAEQRSNEEKRKKKTTNSLGSSPVATTGMVGDEQLNEAAALKTGTQALPKDLNDSWVDRATSRLLEVFRFRR